MYQLTPPEREFVAGSPFAHQGPLFGQMDVVTQQ